MGLKRIETSLRCEFLDCKTRLDNIPGYYDTDKGHSVQRFRCPKCFEIYEDDTDWRIKVFGE